MQDHHYPEEVKRTHRRRACRRILPVMVLPISGIPATEANRVKVTLAATGQDVWLPKIVDFGPGRVVIPAWLYRKIKPCLKPARPPAREN